MHGDVFRKPNFSTLLSVLVGSGMQLLGMSVATGMGKKNEWEKWRVGVLLGVLEWVDVRGLAEVVL